jgi:ATP-dependent protease ClpP protease subunit
MLGLMSEELDAAFEAAAAGSPSSDIAVMRIQEKSGTDSCASVTVKQFAEALDSLSDVKRLHLHIDSRGSGELFAAQAVYCVLVDFKARKRAYIGGVAAGTSTIIMCACDEIIACHNSSVTLCTPQMITIGDADAMRKAADDLEAITTPIVNVYKARVVGKITEKEIRRLMEDETPMSPQEALKKGFVTTVLTR